MMNFIIFDIQRFLNFLISLSNLHKLVSFVFFEQKVTSTAKLLTSRNHAPVYGVATAIFLSLARPRRDRLWKARCVEPRR